MISSDDFHTLRHRIAKRTYQPLPLPTSGYVQTPWEELRRIGQKPWLDDASLAIVMTIEVCARIAEEAGQPHLAALMKGVHVGDPDEDPMPCRKEF